MSTKQIKERLKTAEGMMNEAEFLQDEETYYHYSCEVEKLKKVLATRKPKYPKHLYVRLGDLVSLEV